MKIEWHNITHKNNFIIIRMQLPKHNITLIIRKCIAGYIQEKMISKDGWMDEYWVDGKNR